MSLAFHWPACALLLPLPWLINKLFPIKEKINHDPIVYFPNIDKLTLILNSGSNLPNSSKIRQLIWSIFWLLLVLTIMRPESIQKPAITNQYGYDVMLAIDLSKSMAALDFAKNGVRITRLHAVKEVVAKFVEQRRGDRIGLIVFANSAYTYVPLTFDIDSASAQLQTLAVGMAGDSTAIGDAIGVAIKNLQTRNGEKILILLTDGADNASRIPPLQAAKLAAKHKIKIYTIGVGSNGPVPIRDDDGNLVTLQGVLDEKLLTTIAEQTGGIYARATNKTNLVAIYEQIDKLEKHSGQNQVLLIRNTLHYYPLAAALIVLISLLLLNRRYLYAA